MRRTFITYSHHDAIFVDRLFNDLEMCQDLDASLDKEVLKPGDSIMRIFEEIGNASFLLPILSINSVESNWVKKELRVAIVKSIEEPGFRVIPVIEPSQKWDDLVNKMPPDLREALRDVFKARFDTMPYEEAFEKLVEVLSPPKDPEGLYADIQGPNSNNPFRRVRTEYFENIQLLARSFAEPESVTYERIVELKPTLVEGGRGSGKTMILKSLEASVSICRSGAKSFREAKQDHFGVYCRLTQGSFITGGGNLLDHIPVEVANRLFTSELILQLTNSLIDELQSCLNQGFLSSDAKQESVLVSTIMQEVRPNIPDRDKPSDLDSLKRCVRAELRVINDYLCRRIVGENIVYAGVFVTRGELVEICRCVPRAFKDLSGVTMYFLLDEYENLLPFQKTVINTLVKWSENGVFSVKIATKKTGFRDPSTLEGQEIEESHDYSLVDMDYDIANQEHRSNYKELLLKICQNMLRSEEFAIDDIRKLLEDRQPFDGLKESDVETTVADIVKNQWDKSWSDFDSDRRREYRHRLDTAAVYTILRSRRQRKQFAGFDDLVFLSSGIIRFFLELCGMSYYFAIQDGVDVKKGAMIGIKQQTDACYTLSSYHLITTRKNIANWGPLLQQLVIDLGDIFRHKLFNHLTEPEAARVAITDPQSLARTDMTQVKTPLDVAEMHSVFQVPQGLGGIRPKHATEVQPLEYVPNRLFAPVLQFSMHPRWRTRFGCQDIMGLVDPMRRRDVKAALIQKVGSSAAQKSAASTEDVQKSLFDMSSPED